MFARRPQHSCRLAIVATVALSISLAGQDRRIADLGGLATAPADAPLTLGVRAPAALLARILTELETDAALQTALTTVDAMMRSDSDGLSLLDLDTFRAVGVDLAGTVRIVAMDPGGFLGLPLTTSTSFGVVDAERCAGWLQKLAGGGATEDLAGGGTFVPDAVMGWRFFGSHSLCVTTYGNQDDARERVAQHLDSPGVGRTLGSLPSYGRLREALQIPAHAALFVFCDGWGGSSGWDAEPDPEPPTPGTSIESVLLALTDERLWASTQFDDRFDPMVSLAPGAECRAFLARLPQPAGAITISLADPVEAAVDMIGAFADSEVRDTDEAFDMLATAGISRVELSRVLAHGAIGVAGYPDEDGRLLVTSRPPAIVLFIKVADADATLRIVRQAIRADLAPPLEEDDDGVFRGELAGRPLRVAVIDGHLVIANTEREFDRLRAGEGGWEPRIGAAGLFGFEMELRRFADLADGESRLYDVLGDGRVVVEARVTAGRGILASARLVDRPVERSLPADLFAMAIRAMVAGQRDDGVPAVERGK